RTDTTHWCLIAHPSRRGFHYRLPARWLSEEAPRRKVGPSRGRCELALTMGAMERLVRLLRGLSALDPSSGGGDGETAEAPILRLRRGSSLQFYVRPAADGRRAAG